MIGAATRESGNIVGNSLKTIFSRITTNSSAIGALNDIGISIEDMEGKVKPVSSIIQEIAGKWNQLSDAERQNTAVKVAGTYQLSRFNALMLNYQMAQSATATSMDSFNSAMREQEEYGKSLQARLNQLDAAWWSFSSAVGETVLYDSIIVITSALETMTDSGNGVVSTIGLLPPVITVATVAVYAFSGSFRALVASTYASTSATVAATGATGVFSGALVGLRTVAGLATVALKGLAIATGIGMVFAVAGVAIEKLTNIISENIQKQEELDLYLEKNTSALSSNKDEVEKLITQYNSLSDAKANDSAWDSTKEEEYLKVQQKLGEIFPALIASVDSTGQMHLKNKDAIEQEIKATEKLIDAQNKVTVNTAIEEFEKLNDEINGSWYDSLSNFIYGSLESRIKQQKQIIKSMQENGVDTSVQELELLQLEQLYQQASEKIKAKIFEVADAQSSLKIDSNVSESLQNFVSSLDFSGFDNAQLKGFSDEFGRIQENIQKAINTNDADLYADSIKSLNDLASTSRGFDKELNSFTLSYEEFTNAIEKGQIKIVEGEVVIEDMTNSMSNAANSVSELASKMQDFKDVTESLAGVSQAYVDDLDNLLLHYQGLTDQLAGYTEQQLQDILVKENLNAEEQRVKDILDKRLIIMNELASVYPDLLGKDGKAIALTSEKIEAIKAENKANKVLLEGYKNARDGKLTAEQQMTLAQASATKARIDNIKKELQALNILQTKMQEVYNEQVKKMKDEDPNSYTAGYGAYRSGTILGQTQSKISDYTSELDNLQSSLNSNIGTIDSFNSALENSGKATKDNTNSQKDGNSTTKESIYITDKYRQALEKLTLEIEKQQKLQAKYPEHSKEYRKHLEAQIKLEKEKLALQEKQSKALQSQIASGKIQQTGNISTSSSPSSNQNLSGWNGTISSGYGQRGSEFHRGIDIAMAKGTRLDANIGGKVVASGDAKKNGMSSTYGNVVVIQDTNGMKHIYAHLDKAIAKLGDTITAGMQIGTIGSTGTSTGNHLHYEINKNGNPIDPSNYLNDARNGRVSASYPSSSSQQAVVWNYFKNKGLNDKAIAGIMGNIQQESGFNSSAVNKSSGASGIFQWLGGRKNGLQDYAKSVGKSWSDLQVQLDYAWKELQGSEKKSLASLQRNDLSASQHASEFDRLFERSGGSAVGKRQDYANQYFNQFQGTNGGSGIGIDTSQQAIDQAKSDFYGVQNDALNTREIIEDLNEKLVKSNIAYYNHLSEGVDRSIKKSNILADQQLEHSQAYRDELEKETKHLEYKQSLLHKEANFIREQLKRTDLSPAFKDELTTQLSELSLSWWDVEESINSVDISKLESLSEYYEELRKASQNKIDLTNTGLNENDAVNYAVALSEIIDYLEEIQMINEEELIDLEKEIKSGNHSATVLNDLKEKYQELKLKIQETNNEIRDTFYQASEAKFKIDDKAIGETQDKIDFLNYKLGLIDDKDVKLKVDIYTNMQSEIEDSIAKIDKGIANVIIERNTAIAKGYDTKLYDDKIEGYIEQRRGQLSQIQSIYNQIQTYVSDAANKIKEAESNAYSEASKDIDKVIKETEKRIEVFSDVINTLNKKLEILSESDFDGKIGVISDQLTKSREMSNTIVSEYNKLASTPVYNDEQKAQVESKLKDLKSRLMESNSAIIEYTKSLEEINFNKLISGANKSQKEISRLSSQLQANLDLLDGGKLSGTDLDFNFSLPEGNVLDLSKLIENPVEQLKSVELSIQDIRSSSYGSQITEAEKFYEEMKSKSEQFHTVLLDAIEKFEKEVKLLMEMSSKSKEKEKDNENNKLLESTKNMTKKEIAELKNHYANMKAEMISAMGDFGSEYSGIWDDIIASLDEKISILESKVTKSSSLLDKIRDKEPIKKLNQGISKATNVPAYAKGTNGGHTGGHAIISEEGRELLVYPNNSIALSGNKGAELVDLPKGTHVIPNKQTEQFLEDIPAYANGTSGFNFELLSKESLFGTEEYFSSFSDYMAALKHNTKALNELNTDEKSKFDEIAQLLELYSNPNYKNDSIKEAIYSNLTTLYRPLLNAINKNAENTDIQDALDSTFNQQNDRIDSSAKELWSKITSGADFSVGTSMAWSKDLVKNFKTVEDFVYKYIKELPIEEINSLIDSALNLNQKFEGYWTDDEVSKLNNLRDIAPLLSLDNFTQWNNANSTSINKDFKHSGIESDETGALKYVDKLIGNNLIKGNYLTKDDVKSLFTNLPQFEFTLDDAGKVFNLGMSEHGREMKAKADNDQALSELGKLKDKFVNSSSLNKLSEEYNKQRQPKVDQIKELQKSLDNAKSNKNQSEFERLTKEIVRLQDELNKDDAAFLYSSNIKLSKESIEIANETIKALEDVLNNPNLALTESTIAKYKEEIQNQKNNITNAIQQQKDLISQWMESQQKIWDKNNANFLDQIDDLQFALDMLNDADITERIQINNEILKQQKSYTQELVNQKRHLQNLLQEQEVGSYEWNTINNKVKEYNELIEDAYIQQKNLNKELLSEQFSNQLNEIEKQIFDGKTEEQARKELDNKYKAQDLYLEGLEKELEVEKLIEFARKNEIKLTQEELNLLNSSDKIDKKKLERLQKQLEIRQLEQKLANLQLEKNIQQLRKNEDGSWEYQYVVDQDAIDEVNDQLRDKQLELINFEKEVERNAEREELSAKSDYFNQLKQITDRALSGEISSYKQFSDELSSLNSNFLTTIEFDNQETWSNIFANMSTNIDNMKNTFKTYVDDLKNLAQEAQNALNMLMSLQEEIKEKSNKKVYTTDEFKALDSSSKKDVLNDPNSYVSFNGKDISLKDVATMSQKELEDKYGLATGGYTGEFGSQGKLAFLHEKEIVLNKEDTKNLLKAVDLNRNFTNHFNPVNFKNMINPIQQTTSQIFKINSLSFPNVTNSNQIQDAIKNLPKIATMRINEV
ncbi:phage tail tip lysozyme [Lysinibacillus sp. FSL K6-0057]|uniref:phage tail tip lysozyme n=1 Tax=Lysinibacillus sp. FSL K6-0057 TaxID=2921411 RepID=UPI0031599B7A